MLNCVVGAELSTDVAIWYEPGGERIFVALVEGLEQVPEAAAVFPVADLMAEGLLQRLDAGHVTMAGESRN